KVSSTAFSLAFSPDGRRLASGHENGSGVVWDLFAADPADDRATPQALFNRLRGDDAARAWKATVALLRTPNQAVALSRAHLRARERTMPPAAEIARLIARLDDDEGTIRRQAQLRLELYRPAIDAALRSALAGKPTPEARRRLHHLLDGP